MKSQHRGSPSRSHLRVSRKVMFARLKQRQQIKRYSKFRCTLRRYCVRVRCALFYWVCL